MNKLLRVTFFVLKFIDLCIKSRDVNSWDLTTTDVSKSDRIWIRTVQENCFEVGVQSSLGHGIAMFFKKQLKLFLENKKSFIIEGVLSTFQYHSVVRVQF